MRISDAIAAYILHRMEEAEDGSAELQRNELAEKLGCVPSQINYVLTSRFTPEQGYIVESGGAAGDTFGFIASAIRRTARRSCMWSIPLARNWFPRPRPRFWTVWRGSDGSNRRMPL